MDIVRRLDQHVWREFVDDNPQSQIYHTPEMFQVFERAEGHQPDLWAAVDGGDRPLALLLPVRITLMDGLLRRFTSRAVCYASVLCAPGLEGREALATLLQAYGHEVKGSLLFTELRNMSNLGDLQPVLNGCGFVHEDHLNFLISLDQPGETMWQNLSKGGRKNVRRSGKKGTIVEDLTERQNLAVVYQLLQKTYDRVQIPLPSLTLFEAAFDILAPRGMLKIFMARVGDDYAGTRLVLLHNGKILDWYAGDDRAFSSCYVNELLVWHILEWGHEHHFHLFDFGGGGRPDEDYGPRTFKAKFGGELVCYGRDTCIHAPHRLQLSKLGYAYYRKLMNPMKRLGVLHSN